MPLHYLFSPLEGKPMASRGSNVISFSLLRLCCHWRPLEPACLHDISPLVCGTLEGRGGLVRTDMFCGRQLNYFVYLDGGKDPDWEVGIFQVQSRSPVYAKIPLVC